MFEPFKEKLLYFEALLVKYLSLWFDNYYYKVKIAELLRESDYM